MNRYNLKQIFPHLVAIATFVCVALIFCKPALEGKILQQSDILHWKGMSQDIQQYRDSHDGVAPLWTTSMFGGMPGYQIATNNNNYLSYWANEVFSLFIPKPFRFFILACLGFYFLALVLRINPWIAMTGALGYAYATYNVIIVSVGHDTKMLSIAYLPALLGGLLLIFRGRYIVGAALTGLFSSILISHNHYQIVYYFLILALFLTGGYVVQWVKSGQYRQMAVSLLTALGAGLIGVLANAVMLFTTYDYSKATIRGGQAALNLADSTSGRKQSGGLDTAYAFLYGSYGIAETFTLLVPDMYGGGSNPLGEESKLVETMTEKGLPQQFASQLYGAFSSYWGQQPGHAGPVYLGAIMCFLFVLGMVLLRSPLKWWLLAATLFSILMAWGKNFAVFNTFMFEYLPMYNKFRAPAMILVIPQLCFALVAVMALQEFLFGDTSREEKQKKLRISGLAMAAIFLLLALMYVGFDYRQGYEKNIQQQLTQIAQGDATFGKDIVQAVIEDRKSLFGKDLLRSSFFVAACFAILFLALRGSMGRNAVLASLLVLNLFDLTVVGKRYLANDMFLEPEDYENAFAPTEADMQIKKDPTPNFRVLNLTQSVFNDAITSYHHKSVGGYHAAKLSIYQDLIENQLSRQPMNQPVLNMLNTRYVIAPDSMGTPRAERNPGALGPAWLVQEIRFVADPRAEMKALDQFNPATTAIVQEKYRPSIAFQPDPDSTASIRLEKNENDLVQYSFQSNSNQFAVFSEVFYDRGWKAWIDGKETPIAKVNYVLRGLAVPAGKHSIEFKFQPSSYINGSRITLISQIVLLALLLGSLILEYKKSKKEMT